ncbi:MAG: Phospho-2-dehydro-3-deoxyheptonate aldolase, Tyr-sensitive [Gammaproteobacteria bacterium]|nr:Phospho-2-dehydro-3-deoxyheptonate aldolase, Tyr-sensitive [Gammaproteobacteria bacterium]
MSAIEQAQTRDVHVESLTPLVPPDSLRSELPLTESAGRTIVESRATIPAILEGRDRRLLVVVGPCSIHDTGAALDYAERLALLREKLNDSLYIVMRTYFEKPRTTIGWKGLINDPHLDGSFDMETGLRRARKLLIDVAGMGLPTATEILDPITPQYIDDALDWAAIGARTTESQTHRQIASGLSMTVGYKNSTTGSLEVAINAMHSAREPHAFLGIDGSGRTSLVRTTGNPWGHVILRGGRDKPNYDPGNVAEAVEALKAAGVSPGVMVDCSHANSGKKYERQEVVWNSVVEQKADGNHDLIGVMLESNIEEGNQALGGDPEDLRYGVSITDACIGWEKTEHLLTDAAEHLQV